jgi:hypothetical protein
MNPMARLGSRAGGSWSYHTQFRRVNYKSKCYVFLLRGYPGFDVCNDYLLRYCITPHHSQTYVSESFGTLRRRFTNDEDRYCIGLDWTTY